MPATPLRRRFHRTLAGSVALAALAAASTPVLAGTLTANGDRVIASEQVQANGVAALDAGAQLAISPDGGDSARIAGNALAALAEGNSAAQSFAWDQASPPGAPASGTSRVTSSPGGLFAASGIVVASSQRLDAGAVTAAATGARLAIEQTSPGGGLLAVESNGLAASAKGNLVSGAIDLSGPEVPSAAMLAGLQSVTAGPGITARTQGALGVTLAGPSTASVAIAGNSASAAAEGNGSVQSLAAAPGAWTGAATFGPSAVLAAGGQSLAGRAAYLVAADQHLWAPVQAQASLARGAQGSSAARSRIALSDNTSQALATGNRAAERLTIDARSMASQGFAGWPVSLTPAAGLVATSQIADGAVSASAATSGGIVLGANLTGSRLEVTGGSTGAGAIANRADSILDVRAAGPLAVGLAGSGPCNLGCGGGGGGSGGGTGGEWGGPGGYIGTAAIQDNGAMSTTAPFALLASQVATGPVAASAAVGGDRIAVGGGAAADALLVDGNSAGASALANQAANALSLAGGVVATAADLAARQEASGTVSAVTHWNADPATPALAVGGPASGSTLSVSGNAASASAGGNLAANRLAADGTSLRDGSGHVGSSVSPGSGTIASAAYALASQQVLRAGAGAMPRVTASTAMGAAIALGSGTSGSRLAVDGNEARAVARGNSVGNDLSLGAVTLGESGRAVPGMALGSDQDAAATVRASSRQMLGIAGQVGNSRATIFGNGNVASAVINEAGNRLALDVVSTDGWGLGVAQDLAYGASGDMVLASRQSASGSAAASAVTTAGLSAPGTYREASLEIAGNRVSADAGANRATNRALGLAPEVSSIVHNRQDSTAAVSAAASLQASLAGSYAAESDARMADNSVSAAATGNAAENALALDHAGQLRGSGAAASTEPMGTSSARSLLVNEQVNGGPVRASADLGAEVALNCPGSDSTGLALSGNSLRADARGNSVVNTMTTPGFGATGSLGLVNVQVNSGMVTAQVSSPVVRLLPGAGGGNALAIAGNSIAATAIGNLAVNSIAFTN